MYFSPTGTTEKIVQELVEILAIKFGCEKAYVDFTLPGIRETAQSFGKEDLVVFGTPVYAGRVPNVLLKYIPTRIKHCYIDIFTTISIFIYQICIYTIFRIFHYYFIF